MKRNTGVERIVVGMYILVAIQGEFSGKKCFFFCFLVLEEFSLTGVLIKDKKAISILNINSKSNLSNNLARNWK